MVRVGLVKAGHLQLRGVWQHLTAYTSRRGTFLQAWENPLGFPAGMGESIRHSTRLSHRPWRLATPHGMGDHLWIDLMAWEITSWAHHKETRHAYWVSRAYG